MARREQSSAVRLLRRVVVPALLALAAYYAVFGGEYSVFALRRARAAAEAQRLELERLRTQIDSLRAWADSLEVDSTALERVARERFGMIREGETLYRFADTASGGSDPDTTQWRPR